MVVPKKKRMTLAERLQQYKDQAWERQQSPKSKSRKTGRQKPVHHEPCRIYFWQQVAGGPIRIGRTPLWSNQTLLNMRGRHEVRAHLLAVISATTEREKAIHQQFAASKLDTGVRFYRPTPELLQLIASEATPWEPPVREMPAKTEKPKPPSKFVERLCECGATYRTSVGNRHCKECTKAKRLVERTCECGATYRTSVGNRYCPECEKAKRAELWNAGYLQRVSGPRPCKPENAGAAQEMHGESSPWLENAVRHLEDN